MAETIGERIKAKREELNLTQSQVAEKLFVTQQTVARWEGNKHLPPITALQDLGKLFKVDTSYFFGVKKSSCINLICSPSLAAWCLIFCSFG